MNWSFDFAALRRLYRAGEATPVTVAEEVLARIAAAGNDGVWISRVADDALLAAARALAARTDAAGLPLYGMPFAVKDNIDVAGLPTTCACPDFAYRPARSAPVVERLLQAGAMVVGKTNLDQFATGLVGVRSPYGVPRNRFDPAYIPGGSSSGSAVAVSAGLVAFALGTDTAGSGRVPASFGNIVGLKPTRGLLSASGVYPACRSLDCVSVFTLTVEDAALVAEIARGPDEGDGYSRPAPLGFAALGCKPERFAFGVLPPGERDFFGNPDGPALYETAIARLGALGGTPVEIDYAPFLEVNRLLYTGPWLAERYGAVTDAVGARTESLLPVLRQIITGGEAISGAAVFDGLHRLAALRQATGAAWRAVDCLVLPTTGTTYRISEIESDPIEANYRLGRYTNFCNLLDLSALSVPVGFRGDGLPAGVTLFAPAFHDPLIAAIGQALHQATDLPLGATGHGMTATAPCREPTANPYVELAVVGAHLTGQPLNRQLTDRGARLRRTTRTAPQYRLYALPDGKRPGLVRTACAGVAVEVEIWDVPTSELGSFAAAIPAPLGLGRVQLEDGSEVVGFLCETFAVDGGRDISDFGGWRAWLARA